MDTRKIGALEVGVVGLGCNNFGGRLDEARTRDVVGAAVDAGITLFDTADIYGNELSEELLGRALGTRRDEVVVATKFGMAAGSRTGGAAPSYVRSAVETSLRRLGTDRIDLYQLHTPDERVPIADTLAALDELVGEGKVREIGCSNFSAAQMAEAHEAARTGARFVSVQNEYSILHREPEEGVLAACSRLDVALLPYFPLANGLLTGKYRAGSPAPSGTRIAGMDPDRRDQVMTDEHLATVAALEALASDAGLTLLQLAFAWLLAHDQVASVIAGATTPDQVRANAATAGSALTPDVLARVDEISARPR